MLKYNHIRMIIKTINVNFISLTLPYDVVMMYWNYIKKDM